MTTLNIACAHCETTNRVPSDRLVDNPVCGKCKKPVFSYRPLVANEQNFKKLVLNSDIPVVVDFWATWCGPCVQFAPTFEQAAAGWEPRLRFVKVESEANAALAGSFNIRSIPTIALFHQGKEITRQSGAMPAQMFDQWLEKQISTIPGA